MIFMHRDLSSRLQTPSLSRACCGPTGGRPPDPPCVTRHYPSREGGRITGPSAPVGPGVQTGAYQRTGLLPCSICYGKQVFGFIAHLAQTGCRGRLPSWRPLLTCSRTSHCVQQMLMFACVIGFCAATTRALAHIPRLKWDVDRGINLQCRKVLIIGKRRHARMRFVCRIRRHTQKAGKRRKRHNKRTKQRQQLR